MGNAELEWDVMGYYAPDGAHFSHNEIWAAIDFTIDAIGQPLSEKYQSVVIPTTESKTERILSTIEAQGISTEQISEWNLKPWEFLKTQSLQRRKTNDPSRSVNLLGRLNRLFYQQDFKLPSLKQIHDVIA